MIVMGPEADKEIESVQVVEGDEPGLHSFAYLRLTDEDFERLSYALSKRSAPIGIERTWDDAALMVRGADAGRDVLLMSQGKPVGVVQCKRLERGMTLPAVFREIAKLILLSKINGDLSFQDSILYMLVLARDPASTVVDFFASYNKPEPDHEDGIRAAAREVLDSFVTLTSITPDEAEVEVLRAFSKLSLKLIRPTDLNEWMWREPLVSGCFFRQRIVVDSAEVVASHNEIMDALRMRSPFNSIAVIFCVIISILTATHYNAHKYALKEWFGIRRDLTALRNNLSVMRGSYNECMDALVYQYTFSNQILSCASKVNKSFDFQDNFLPHLVMDLDIETFNHVDELIRLINRYNVSLNDAISSSRAFESLGATQFVSLLCTATRKKAHIDFSEKDRKILVVNGKHAITKQIEAYLVIRDFVIPSIDKSLQFVDLLISAQSRFWVMPPTSKINALRLDIDDLVKRGRAYTFYDTDSPLTDSKMKLAISSDYSSNTSKDSGDDTEDLRWSMFVPFFIEESVVGRKDDVRRLIECGAFRKDALEPVGNGTPDGRKISEKPPFGLGGTGFVVKSIRIEKIEDGGPK